MIAELPFMLSQTIAENAYEKMREMGIAALQQELDQYWRQEKWEPLPGNLFEPSANVLTLATGYEKTQKEKWSEYRRAMFEIVIPGKTYTIGKLLTTPKFIEDAVSFDAWVGKLIEDAVKGLSNSSLSAKGFWRSFGCLVLPELSLFRWPGSDYMTFANKGRSYHQRARAQYLFLGEDSGFTTSFVNGVFERPAIFHDSEFVRKVKEFCVEQKIGDAGAKAFLKLLGCRLAVCDLHKLPDIELRAIFNTIKKGPRIIED
jgi:hypothetical protein